MNPEGKVLTEKDLSGLSFALYDEQQRPVGTADVSGLDKAADGHFVGVIYLANLAAGPVFLKALNSSKTHVSDLGSGLVWEDDFTPFVDPSIHKITVLEMNWRDAEFFSLEADVEGFGRISNVNGEYLSSTAITISSVAAERFEFLEWLGDIPIVDQFSPVITIVLDKDRTLTARFGRSVPSEWMITHFGTDEVDLEADPDEDGISTRMEFEVGTHPNNGNQLSTETLDLKRGWNLISFPVQPPSGTALGAIPGFNPGGHQWFWNSWKRQFGVADRVLAKQGIWIYVTSELTAVEITGQNVIDNSLLLIEGWNLVGSATAKSVSNEKAIADFIWDWDPKRRQFVAKSKSEPLMPKTAYWIYADEDIVVSN